MEPDERGGSSRRGDGHGPSVDGNEGVDPAAFQDQQPPSGPGGHEEHQERPEVLQRPPEARPEGVCKQPLSFDLALFLKNENTSLLSTD